MDITKFYPSIDHNILKSIISRKIKDTKVLEILYEIIDSVNGWDNFTHEVVYSNLNKQAADKLEKELIHKYNSIEDSNCIK